MSRRNLVAVILGILTLCGIPAEAADFKATCTIDRSHLTMPVPWQELTLRLPVGDATSADVLVDGITVQSRIDPVAKRVIFTTNGSAVEVRIYGASSQTQIGSFSKAVLRDDRKWAWSHGFDDNVTFMQYGVPIFEEYGWPASIFLIGQAMSADSVLPWDNTVLIMDKATDQHLRRLRKKGWAIANHSWSHNGTGSLGEIVQCQERISQALAPVDPTYKTAAFAGPMLSHDYDNIIRDTRSDPVNGPGIMFSESQGNESGNMRIDVGGPAETMPWAGMNCVTDFDPSELWIPRFGKTSCFFNPANANDPWPTSRPKEFIVDSIVKYSNSDDQHHYWFNTFEHGVDGCRTDADHANDSSSVLGLVPYLYKHYGPAGDNTIWVETSERIFSYVITQRHAVLTGVSVVPYSGTAVNYALAGGSRLSGPAITKRLTRPRVLSENAALYDLRGQRTHNGSVAPHGVYVVRSIVR